MDDFYILDWRIAVNQGYYIVIYLTIGKRSILYSHHGKEDPSCG